MILTIYEALLWIQSALGNAVAPSLRCTMVDFDKTNNRILLIFIYDGEVSEEIEELTSLIDTEICHPKYLNSLQIFQIDFPNQIPIRGKLAYLREESLSFEYKRENRSFLLKENFSPHAVYSLDMQEALLGKVTPSLRYVGIGIDENQKKMIAHFIYDGKISEKDFGLASAAIEESRISFPEYEMQSYIERIDFPDEISHRGSGLAYWRHEWDYDKNSRVPAIHKK